MPCLALFFLWDEEGNSPETNISNLSCIASNLPAIAVYIPVVHRQKCCQLNNCFCLTYFQSFARENPLIFISLGLLGHEFSVCVFEFFFFLYMHLLVCFLVLLLLYTALSYKLMKTAFEKIILCYLSILLQYLANPVFLLHMLSMCFPFPQRKCVLYKAEVLLVVP